MNSSHPEEDVVLQKDVAAGVIRLKAVGTFGDPVELAADAARELAQQLTRLADELD